MSVAFCLAGRFDQAPAYVRAASAQPTFAGFHAIVAINGKPGTFVDEYSGETDRDATGHTVYNDCAPASGCMGINAMTHGRIAVSSAVREKLQAAVKAGTAMNFASLQTGVTRLWPEVKTLHSYGWSTILKELDDGSGSCWVGEPMAKSKSFQRVKIADLKAFCATTTDEYLKIPEEADDNVNIIKDAVRWQLPRRWGVAAGSIVNAYDGKSSKPVKSMSFSKASSASAIAIVTLSGDDVPTAAQFIEVTNGAFAGLYVPLHGGVTITDPLGSGPDVVTKTVTKEDIMRPIKQATSYQQFSFSGVQSIFDDADPKAKVLYSAKDSSAASIAVVTGADGKDWVMFLTYKNVLGYIPLAAGHLSSHVVNVPTGITQTDVDNATKKARAQALLDAETAISALD